MRALARSLVACDQTAEDLVQEAFVAAAERPPRQAATLGNWLAVVIRNGARSLRLQESRRRRHERAAADAATTATDQEQDSGFDRMELLRLLVEAVQGLPPHYREVIVLRFFEDLAPRHIARRLDVPVATVRTRIRRGLEALRERLDASGGGRETWVSSFLPLALPVPAATSSAPTWAAPESRMAGALQGAVGMQLQLNKSLAVAGVLLLALTAGMLTYDLAWSGPDPATPPASERMAQLAREADTPNGPQPQTPTSDSRERSDNALTRLAAPTEPSTTIHGRVIERSDRSAVPGVDLVARVFRKAPDVAQIEPSDEPPATADAPFFETRVRSDEAGAFSFELPDRPDSGRSPEAHSGTATLAGQIRFEVIHDGWTHRAENMHLRHGVLNGLEVEVVRLDAEVEGHVTGPDGQPVAGAQVRVGFEQTTARTDADGRYRLRYPFRNGRLELTVLAPGFGVHQAELQLDPSRDEPFRHDVQLATARVLRGRVVTAANQPVPNAAVFSGLMVSHTRTDAEGHFTIDWTPGSGPSAPRHVYVRARGYLDGSARIPPVSGPADSSDLCVELAKATPVTGIVIDSNGVPIVGAAIYARPENTNNRDADALTDENGRFEAFTSPDWKSLTVDAAGFALARFGLEHTPDGAGIDLGRLALAAGRTVTGRVTDRSGRPLSGVAVFGRMQSARATHEARSINMGLLTITDGAGDFALSDMPTVGLALNFVERGFLPERVDPVPASLVVALHRQGGLAGRVLDGRTGAPLDSFAIRLAVSDRGERRIQGWRSRWEDGREFQGTGGQWSTAENRFPDAHWLGVSASAPGYAPSPFRSVQTTENPVAEDCVIELWPGGIVSGRCVDATGAPLPGVSIRLFPSLREGASTGPDPDAAGSRERAAMRPLVAKTDREGAFSFRSVSPGPASLLASIENRPRTFVPSVQVPRQGAAAPLALTLATGAIVEGAVVRPRDGSRIESIALIPRAPAPGQRRRVHATLSNGGARYLVTGLPAGTYDLVVERSPATQGGSDSLPSWTRQVEIGAGVERLVADIDAVTESTPLPADALPRERR